LIGLASAGHLDILRGVFGHVVIPPAVLCELELESGRGGADVLREAVEQSGWISVDRSGGGTEALTAALGAGEAEAIRLAESRGAVLLIDDRRGRVAARSKGIPVIGAGRVLVLAKARGILGAVLPAIEALDSCGYRLAEPLKQRILRLAGEA